MHSIQEDHNLYLLMWIGTFQYSSFNAKVKHYIHLIIIEIYNLIFNSCFILKAKYALIWNKKVNKLNAQKISGDDGIIHFKNKLLLKINK